jgi:hypothetical protein
MTRGLVAAEQKCGSSVIGTWVRPACIRGIGRDGTRAQVIERYGRWLDTQPELLAALPQLKGKTLGCWCAPQACHGDVLARLANAPR